MLLFTNKSLVPVELIFFILVRFWNVLEKCREDQLGWSCEKWRTVTDIQGISYRQ